MKKLTFLISLCLCMALHATTSKTINVSIAGTLSSYFTTAEDSAVNNLTITGNIDARDFYFLESLSYTIDSLNLDLKDANIVSYKGKNGTSWSSDSVYYPDNELPEMSLNNMPGLYLTILPTSLTSIGAGALSGFTAPNSLKTLDIPEGVTSIGDYCGIGQINLKTLTLPSTLIYLGNSSFQGSYSNGGVSTITNLNPTPIIIDSTCFKLVNKSACTLYVPYGSGDAYKNAAVWKEFNVVELPQTTAINETSTHNSEETIIAYYSITGVKLSNEPKSGIYIVVYNNGKAEKRIKKENL